MIETTPVQHEAPPLPSEDIAKLLDVWFTPIKTMGLRPGLTKWFAEAPETDAELEPWRPLVETARAGKLQTWTTTADGTLALLILLDQIPRNLYRGTPAAFYSDKQGLDLAIDAIATGMDRQVPLERQMFFYLPFMHQEDMLAQVGCLGLYQGMLARAEPGTEMHSVLTGALMMCQQHVDDVRRFGRFPIRNKTLGRESTAKELEYLAKKGK